MNAKLRFLILSIIIGALIIYFLLSFILQALYHLISPNYSNELVEYSLNFLSIIIAGIASYIISNNIYKSGYYLNITDASNKIFNMKVFKKVLVFLIILFTFMFLAWAFYLLFFDTPMPVPDPRLNPPKIRDKIFMIISRYILFEFIPLLLLIGLHEYSSGILLGRKTRFRKIFYLGSSLTIIGVVVRSIQGCSGEFCDIGYPIMVVIGLILSFLIAGAFFIIYKNREHFHNS